jgi:general secretion pathway protein G
LELLRTRTGISLIELIVTITILGILAAGVMPLIRNTAIRSKEIELRRNLRIIRIALDDYKKTYDKVPPGAGKPANKSGYPETLQELVDGKDFGDSAKSGTVKFLRRKVLNPLNPKSTEDENWGWELRSYKDNSDSTSWGKEDVFDVYATNEDTIALDGTKYKDW